MPQGPVIMSPDRLFQSLHREVVIHRPQDFKIRALSDVHRLFMAASPLPNYTPFYAGFGNRGTDSISYKSVGVPEGKIFIINPQSEITSEKGVRIFHPDGALAREMAKAKHAGSTHGVKVDGSATDTETSGYATMAEMVEHIFPYVEKSSDLTDVEMVDNGFDSGAFWRAPLPDIDLDLAK